MDKYRKKKGNDFLSKKFNKGSVGKAVLTVSLASTVTLGGLMYSQNKKLESNVNQLDEAQARIEKMSSDYKMLNNQLVGIITDKKAAEKRNSELTDNVNKLKVSNNSLKVQLRESKAETERVKKNKLEQKRKLAQFKTTTISTNTTNSNSVRQTKNTSNNSDSSDTGYNGWKKMIVESTAYSTYENGDKLSGQQWGGLTASGTQARDGVIAVDPNVIPLGSTVYIPKLGRTFQAEDTGSAIKGNIIDVFFSSMDACKQWGRQYNVEIYVKP